MVLCGALVLCGVLPAPAAGELRGRRGGGGGRGGAGAPPALAPPTPAAEIGRTRVFLKVNAVARGGWHSAGGVGHQQGWKNNPKMAASSPQPPDYLSPVPEKLVQLFGCLPWGSRVRQVLFPSLKGQRKRQRQHLRFAGWTSPWAAPTWRKMQEACGVAPAARPPSILLPSC